MGDDISIPLTSMEHLNDALKNIVLEFEDAGKAQGEVMDAIGRPLDRSGLRDQAHDFEDQWDDKRETLRRKLVDLQKHVEGSKNGWEKLDADLAKALEHK